MLYIRITDFEHMESLRAGGPAAECGKTTTGHGFRCSARGMRLAGSYIAGNDWKMAPTAAKIIARTTCMSLDLNDNKKNVQEERDHM